MSHKLIAGCFLSACMLVQGLFAQEDAKRREPGFQIHYYRLDYVVKDLEGTKVISAHTYSTSVANNTPGRAGSIRSNSRVPLVSGSAGNINLYEVGVNIDTSEVQELSPTRLGLSVNADITSLIPGTQKEGERTPPPITRSTKWSAVIQVPLNKPTTIFSSDDPSGTRKMQLELTVTPIP